MKRFAIAAFVLFLGLSFSLNSYAQDKEQKAKEETKAEVKSEVKSDTKPINTICPVSTEEADQEITYTYKGKTYAVCCNTCLKKFKKDPEKYISRLSEDGKTLKKKGS